MRLVFWQNSISPHQMPYIIRLIEHRSVDKVVVVVPYALSSSRQAMGWEIESYNSSGYELYVTPDYQKIEQLLKERPDDSFHLFSGIRGFKFVFNAFQHSLKYNIKRGLITERPNTFSLGLRNGKPLWLHKLRFKLQDKKFVPYISCVFAIGEEAVCYYKSLSTRWKVFPFTYCTQIENIENLKIGNRMSTQFVFVGSLSWRKAPKDILKALFLVRKHNVLNCEMAFIGNGKLLSELRRYVSRKRLPKVSFLGNKPNSEAMRLLVDKDVLILPSVHDGWGAVVNEALSRGLYVICSNRCGSKELLADSRCGRVFEAENYKELAQIMSHCVQHIEDIRLDRKFRREWALRSISGEVISNYMVGCLLGQSVLPPWK